MFAVETETDILAPQKAAELCMFSTVWNVHHERAELT